MKKIIIIVVAIVVIGGVYLLLKQNNSGSNPVTTKSPRPTVAATPSPTKSPVSVSPSLIPTSTLKPNSAPVTHAVTIQGFAFKQSPLTIKKGDTIVWTNADSVPHTVTGNSGGPASPTVNPNGTYSFKFTSTGTFDYHCSFHPSMIGTVVVTQ